MVNNGGQDAHGPHLPIRANMDTPQGGSAASRSWGKELSVLTSGIVHSEGSTPG